ncbi:MAG: coproporphyrinogen dehydrogenase HemZ [Oscillospiraceae bacterium]|nr:coproporphyrinogen dehydrogenase HemZ [Oscillospiraceae bacterium]
MLLYLNHSFHYELENLCRVFYPEEAIRVVRIGSASGKPRGRLRAAAFPVAVTRVDGVRLTAELVTGRKRLKLARQLPEDTGRAAQELALAQSLFVLLRRATGIAPPWGLLTGVRPAKLMRKLRREDGPEEAERYFRESLWVSDEKTALAARVAQAEEPVLALTRPESFSLYVSIPFCPSRCSYCSFVSHTVERPSAKRLIPAYVERLCGELRVTAEIAQSLGLRMESVYIGGGTPTTLAPEQMHTLCACLRDSFDWSHCGEFTVEAGRPDTITDEILAVMREHGANRISINPQSLNDAVLERVGRRHTASRIFSCFARAREFQFNSINMDLIAGLPGDTPESFRASLEGIIALRPENITVHTLAFKRSAELMRRPGAREGAEAIRAMLETAGELLLAAGYSPYYMYRQSRSLGNLENIGWTLPGGHCRYNIDMMEESHTVLACGAGAVTKLKAPGSSHLERVFHFKYPYEYLDRFDELLRRKERITAFYREHT